MSAIRAKEFHFPVDASWTGGRRCVVDVAGKRGLPITPPPEFRGPDPSVWSPEDALVAAAASCLLVTITGLAQKEGLPLRSLEVRADGAVGRRADGRFGFTRIEQRVELEADDGCADDARDLVARAESRCLVAVSLDVPVETTIDVHAHPATLVVGSLD